MIKKWLFGNEKRSLSSGALWNTVGGMINAGQAALIMIFASYFLDVTASGLISIAFATANVFMSLAKWGVRNFQVTDACGSFSFSAYFCGRMISFVGTALCLALYLGIYLYAGTYSFAKTLLVLEVSALKLVDAVEDVYAGEYQRQGRLDVASKIMTLRLAVSTAVICFMLIISANILLSFFAGLLISVAIDIYCLGQTRRRFGCICQMKLAGQTGRLLKSCLPLCIGSTLSIYLSNAPKFMIDRYMSEDIQGIFGYMIMPVFVITLLSNFLYQPAMQIMGILWEKRDPKKFIKYIYTQVAMLAGGTVLILLVGGTIGLPVLSVLYNSDLSGYRVEFLILLLGGSLYAFAYYLTVVLTTVRKQNTVAIGYLVAVAFNLIGGRWFVTTNGIMGAARLFLCSNLLLCVFCLVILIGNGALTEKSPDRLYRTPRDKKP